MSPFLTVCLCPSWWLPTNWASDWKYSDETLLAANASTRQPNEGGSADHTTWDNQVPSCSKLVESIWLTSYARARIGDPNEILIDYLAPNGKVKHHGEREREREREYLKWRGDSGFRAARERINASARTGTREAKAPERRKAMKSTRHNPSTSVVVSSARRHVLFGCVAFVTRGCTRVRLGAGYLGGVTVDFRYFFLFLVTFCHFLKKKSLEIFWRDR